MKQIYPKKMEFLLLFCFLICFLLVFTIQLLHLFPAFNSKLNLAIYLEGEPFLNDHLQLAGGISSIPWANLTLKLMNYPQRPDVEIIINGEKIADFSRDEVSFNVKKGDLITLFNPQTELPVLVKVDKKTPNILVPSLETQVKGVGRIYLATISLK